MASNGVGDSLPSIAQNQVPPELQPFLGGILREFEKLGMRVSQLEQENKRLSEELARKGSESHLTGDASGPDVVEPGLASGDFPSAVSTAEQPPHGVSPQSSLSANPPVIRQEVAHNPEENGVQGQEPPSLTSAQNKLATDEQLRFVAESLDIKSWQPFVRTLGIKDNQLEAIKYDYSGVKEQKYQALLKWKGNFGVRATTEQLVKTLIRREHRSIAEKFCEEFLGYDHLLSTKR